MTLLSIAGVAGLTFAVIALVRWLDGSPETQATLGGVAAIVILGTAIWALLKTVAKNVDGPKL